MSAVALLCGLGLIALSWVWPFVSSGRSQWSDQQAREYQRVSTELHGLSHEFARQQEEGSDVDAVAEKLKSAQSEFSRLHQDLEAARQSPLRIASLLRLLGLALIVVGVIVHYSDRFRTAA